MFWGKNVTKMVMIKNKNVLFKKISQSSLDDSLMNSLFYQRSLIYVTSLELA